MAAGRIGAIKALAGKPRADEARQLLERVSKEVQGILERHDWRVGRLEEFCPANPSLQGMNVNRGAKILLRLRSPSSDAFLPWHHVIGTMLHEMVHNEHGPHSAKFYKLLDELYSEYERGEGRAAPAAPAPFVGRGRALGGGGSSGLAAAERRRAFTATNGRRLGGGRGGATPEEVRRRVRLAAEKRVAQGACVAVDQGCDQQEEPPSPPSPEAPAAAPEPSRPQEAPPEALEPRDGHGAAAGRPQRRRRWRRGQAALSCGICSLRNREGSLACAACDAPLLRPGADREACERCTLLNPATRATCEACGAGLRKVLRLRGWECPCCARFNTQDMARCLHCGTGHAPKRQRPLRAQPGAKAAAAEVVDLTL